MKGQLETPRMRRARRRRRIFVTRLVAVLVVLLLVVLGCVLIFGRSKVEKELTVEAGSAMPQVTDFLKRDSEEVELISGLDDSVDMNTVGEYQVVLRVSGKEYQSVLHVVDTTAPAAATKTDVNVFTTEKLDPNELITDLVDATEVTTEFVTQPDLGKTGEQEVQLKLTDQGGNVLELTVTINVVEDTEAPVIRGVAELSVPAGSSISYKRDVTVTDNYDESVDLTVDNSQVDLNTVGDYTVVYIAEDQAGNVAQETTIVHVEKPSVENATEELVNAEADAILAEITTPEMTQYEVAEAIFFWVHENVAWHDGTPKTNWVQGAYRGLVERRGDCFVYASTSKCLLTQAGIENMDIAKIPAETSHYWNLIDLGEGWYHFDNTRRKDGHYFFYTSDEDILAYSRTHKGSHNYDPEEYPKIQQKASQLYPGRM